MQQFVLACFRRAAARLKPSAWLARLLLASLLLGGATAHAVELGEPVLRSYVGQPLVADIELTMLSDPAATIQVRVSNPDVYRGANIAMHPLVPTLNLSIMKRDNRQYLHVTSTKPLSADYLHLFLNLTQAGKSNVRAVTLWLAPEPPPPVRAPAPVPAPAPTPASAPAPAPVSTPTAAPAPAPVPVPVPVLAAPVAAAAPPLAKGLRLRQAPAEAMCPAQKYTAEQIKACSSLDYKNGLLSAQIVELEEKVKLLQLAIEGKREGAPPAAAVAAPVIKGPVAIKPEAHPKKDKAKTAEPGHEQTGGLPWLWIGIGSAVAALIAGGVFFLLRRRKKKKAAGGASGGAGGGAAGAAAGGANGESDIAAIVSPEDRADYMAKLKESLQRKKKEAAGS